MGIQLLLALGGICSCGNQGKNVKVVCVKRLCIKLDVVFIITIFNEPKKERRG